MRSSSYYFAMRNRRDIREVIFVLKILGGLLLLLRLHLLKIENLTAALGPPSFLSSCHDRSARILITYQREIVSSAEVTVCCSVFRALRFLFIQ